MKQKLTNLLLCSTLTMPVAAIADVPNVFTAGTKAKAADVNENFKYLDDKVNTLSASAGFSSNTYKLNNSNNSLSP